MIAIALLFATQATPPPAPPRARELRVDFEYDDAFFAAHDANRDGALDLAEFQAGNVAIVDAAVSRNPEALAAREPGWEDKVRAMTARVFANLDTDGDGRITRAGLRTLARAQRPQPAP